MGISLMVASGMAAGAPLEANCLVEPGQVVNVGSPVTGLLDEVLVKRADRRQQIPLISSIPKWVKTGFWKGVLYGLMLCHASLGVALSRAECGRLTRPLAQTPFIPFFIYLFKKNFLRLPARPSVSSLLSLWG
jgi:hypothetical protein